MNQFARISLLLIAAVAGCSGEAAVPRGPVKGRITMGGKPLANATVVFENSEIGVAQSAATDDDGKYEFTSYDAKGLPAASYKVAVVSGRFMKPGEEIPFVDITKPPRPPSPPSSNIPAKYTKADTSGLTAEVKANENPSIDFELEP